MALNKEQATASLYNLKSVVDGMVSAVKSGVLDLRKALEVVGQTCADIAERNDKE